MLGLFYRLQTAKRWKALRPGSAVADCLVESYVGWFKSEVRPIRQAISLSNYYQCSCIAPLVEHMHNRIRVIIVEKTILWKAIRWSAILKKDQVPITKIQIPKKTGSAENQ